MHLFSTYHFDLLKTELTAKAGIPYITPADCKMLSAALFSKTQKSISETTLKRIFGFAYSKFTPSLFTMNALAEFCGYTGWEQFCINQSKATTAKQNVNIGLDKVIARAEKITNFTLQTLINHSGIPYQHTVPRKFIDEHLSIFMQQPYSGTLFTAPAGYGKTIGLCHWVNDLIKANAAKANKDIILFLNGETVNSSLQNIHLGNWLMAMTGICVDDDLNGLTTIDEKFKGRFILIIDGFDDFCFKNNAFEIIFNQLMDVVNLYHKQKWFKVILNMRSATYSNISCAVTGKPDVWFTGFMIDNGQKLNVPLLSSEEIKKLSNNINPNKNHDVTLTVVNKLNLPMYFEYYYQKYNDDFGFEQFNELSYYHLVSAHFLRNVYKGHYAVDKALIIVGIISQMDIDNQVYYVNKLRVNELIRKYAGAYQELISNGIFEELNLSDNKLNVVVKMSTEPLLDYALAMILLYNNNYLFDDNLVALTQTLFEKEKKLSLVKWFIYKAIYKNYKFDINSLLSIPLQPNEKSEIISFIGELLKVQHVSLQTSERMEDLFRQVCGEDFFNYFIGLEFIDIGYEQVLDTFLHFRLSTHQQILIKTCLAVIAVMQLDLVKLEKHLNELKQFNLKSIQNLPINPVNCLETIFFYLKYGIIKKDGLADITKFYFNPKESASQGQSKGFMEVIYLLALYTSTICQKHNKAARLISALNKVNQSYSAGYSFILKVIMAESYLISGHQDKAMVIFKDLKLHYNEQEAGFTPLMKVLYQGLKIKLTLENTEHQAVVNNIKNLIKLCDDSKQIFIKVNTLAFILSNYAILKENISVFNDLYFDFVKSIRTNGCRTEHFLNEEVKLVESRNKNITISGFVGFDVNEN